MNAIEKISEQFLWYERVLNDQIEIIGPTKKRRKAGSDDDNDDVDDDDNVDDDDDNTHIIDHINCVDVEHVCRVPAIWTPASRLPLGSLRKYKNKQRYQISKIRMDPKTL